MNKSNKQIAEPDSLVSRGAAVRLVRTALYVGDFGRKKLTQPGLYTLCGAIEAALPPQPGSKRRSFGPVDDGRAKKKVRAIEARPDAQQSAYELFVIAKAFGLSDDFFARPFDSRTQLEEAFKLRARISPAAPRPPPLAPAAGGRRPLGFPNISNGEPVPKTRREAAEAFANQVAPSGTVKSMLVLLQGRTGVGKSFFIGHWFRDYGRSIFGENSLRIDCTTSSLDQILPAVEQHFVSSGGKSHSTISEALAANSANLIVLDGLKLERFGEGRLLSSVGLGRRPPLRELAELIAPLLAHSSNTVVTVCLENNSHSIPDATFVRVLDERVKVMKLDMTALTAEEGAEFLATLDPTLTDKKQRILISTRLHGMPMALVAAASDLLRLSAAERESYLESVRVSARTGHEDDFVRFFRNHLQHIESARRGENAIASDPHPHAFLRLLALMPGPLPRSHLTEILGEKRLTRLKNLTVEAAMLAEVPFTEVVDDQIDVHAMVRRILRAEMDGYVASGMYDQNITREELEWVHWRAAILNWRIIQRRKEPTVHLVAAIEAFVHHMMAQTRLVPKEGNRRARKFSGGVDARVIETFEQDAGKLSNAKLWLLAYHRAVRPFLLDKLHVATRIHGQYEAKARILQMLTAAVADGIPVPPLELAELYKETALCWMHAGRLKSAVDAVKRASDQLPHGRRHFLSVPPDPEEGDGAAAEAWRLRCDIESASITIESRQARLFSEALEELRPMLEQSLSISSGSKVWGHVESPRRAPSALRGSLRIISRAADVVLQGGDAEEAIRLFNHANELQNVIRGRPMDGEAARKFVLALVRTRDAESGRFDRAVTLVDSNIKRLEEDFPIAVGGVSNDLIPFLVLRAGLQRVQGDLKRAGQTLLKVRHHDFVRRGECTFVSAAELELEEIRLNFVMSGSSQDLFERAAAARRRLFNAHHYLMSYEAALLAAECRESDARTEILDECERFFDRTNALLRLLDVAEARHGSAIRRYGL
jgi:hypothetical protein